MTKSGLQAAEESLVHEGEAFATTEDVVVDDPLETDMHPIAEHPTDEAEAAAETPAEVRYFS